MATRPGFGQWLKHTWLDIVTMAVMGAIGLGVRFLASSSLLLVTRLTRGASLRFTWPIRLPLGLSP